jgi:hypothetical protein
MQGSGATVVIPRNKKRLTTGNIKQDGRDLGPLLSYLEIKRD